MIENDKNLQIQTIQFVLLPSKVFGDVDFALSATSNSALPVQFASSNPKIAFIQNGKVHIVGTGTCSIVSYQDGNDAFLPAIQSTQSLVVGKGNQTITLPTITNKAMGDADFSAGATASSGLVCTYTSSIPTVAAIVNGLIQIKGAGTVIISAKQAGNVNYNAPTDFSQELIVYFRTGSSLQSIENDFEIFPNPTSENVRIRLNSNKSKITIFNPLGAQVYTNSTLAPEITIPVCQIGAKGVYFVHVNSTIKKLFINKLNLN